MKAVLVMRQRVAIDDDVFAEIVIWKLPKSLAESAHDYKYRLALISGGKCVLRYDNEAGKGDHKHLGRRELDYEFGGVDRLLSDFFDDVQIWRRK